MPIRTTLLYLQLTGSDRVPSDSVAQGFPLLDPVVSLTADEHISLRMIVLRFME